jgi:hypothetical protein
MAHPVLATLDTAFLLIRGEDVWLDFGLWLGISMVAFVLLRSASRAKLTLGAIATAAAGGALCIGLHMLVTRWLLWQRLWPSRHEIFWQTLPVEIVLSLVLASIEGLWWALFAFIVRPRRAGASFEQADWACIGAALWTIAYALISRAPWAVRVNYDDVIRSVLAAALLAAVAVRIVRRRRWVRLVSEQRIAGWRIVTTVDGASSDLPVLLRVDDPTAGVLVRATAGGQPFREGDHVEAVARVGAARSPLHAVAP